MLCVTLSVSLLHRGLGFQSQAVAAVAKPLPLPPLSLHLNAQGEPISREEEEGNLTFSTQKRKNKTIFDTSEYFLAIFSSSSLRGELGLKVRQE